MRTLKRRAFGYLKILSKIRAIIAPKTNAIQDAVGSPKKSGYSSDLALIFGSKLMISQVYHMRDMIGHASFSSAPRFTEIDEVLFGCGVV